MNIPTWLTLARVAMIPVLVLLIYIPFPWHFQAAALVFGLAAITDWVDGYLARRWNQTTALGAFLDPVADKLMVAVTLVLLVEQLDHFYFTLPASVIICREIVVSALREWMAELGKRAQVAVSAIGKIKTTFQMMAILGFLLIPGVPYQNILQGICYVLLYIAAVLTLWSMVLYLQAAYREMREAR